MWAPDSNSRFQGHRDVPGVYKMSEGRARARRQQCDRMNLKGSYACGDCGSLLDDPPEYPDDAWRRCKECGDYDYGVWSEVKVNE